MDKPLVIAGRAFRSRLLMGTGKFSSPEVMREALEASGAEIITVALRRVDIEDPHDSIVSAIDTSKYLLLPNTSGARDANEAVRLARLARAAGCEPWIKLRGYPRSALPFARSDRDAQSGGDTCKRRFYCFALYSCRPNSGQAPGGYRSRYGNAARFPHRIESRDTPRDAIEIIIEGANIPVVVDAGLGAPSHAAEALEMGADAVFINTAIAIAGDPVAMALSFKKGVEAGRGAFVAGLGRSGKEAEASSPLTGFLR